jgi:hypothetical protein
MDHADVHIQISLKTFLIFKDVLNSTAHACWFSEWILAHAYRMNTGKKLTKVQVLNTAMGTICFKMNANH